MVTIVGGGRYDGLIEELGGRPTPGIGYGMGLERVIQNIQRQNAPIPDDRDISAMIVHLGDAAKGAGIRIASGLRQAGISASLAPPRGMRSQLRYASNTGATHAVIIGDDELEKGVATLRDLDNSSQSEVLLDSLAAALGIDPAS